MRMRGEWRNKEKEGRKQLVRGRRRQEKANGKYVYEEASILNSFVVLNFGKIVLPKLVCNRCTCSFSSTTYVLVKRTFDL